MNPFSMLSSCWCCLCLFAALSGFAEPLMHVTDGARTGTELLLNGGFEQRQPEAKIVGWRAAPNGFLWSKGNGHNGSCALHCENPSGTGWYGASQLIVLDRTNILPFLVSGWSKASNVNGSSDNDYSLYVDIVYADGTSLWGQTANFRAGTHDWERRELLILPEKPVHELTIHCLFRNHSGQVDFDDISVLEMRAEGEAVLFQGSPVMPVLARVPVPPSRNKPSKRVVTRDGLSLTIGNAITSLVIGGKEFSGHAPSAFLVRDVLSNSDFYSFQVGACPELGLKLDAHFLANPNYIAVDGRLSDTKHTDRALTLVFALPIDAANWTWGEDIRRDKLITGQGDFTRLTSIKCGATGTSSLYPLAAISSQSEGLALAIDMAQPAQYRLGYHAGTKQFYIAYDFALVPEAQRGTADFRFVIYRFEPRWGFRAAFQKLMEIFPEYFRVRARDQGLWMPFTDISTVQSWEDFGFKFHEGNSNVPWDDSHGILSFRYTEPMTWWMRMPKELPRTVDEAVRLRDQLAGDTKRRERELAQASQIAAMWDDLDQPSLLFRNEPWCNGAVWSLNPNPKLPGSPIHNAATVDWNDGIRESLYGAASNGKQDGEYLDSLEGYVTAELNFRSEHFRYSTVPLVFSTDTKQPALFKGLAVFEFTRWFSDQVHHLDKLMFANGVPYRFTYLCPWLDVLGTETDWVRNGKYAPVSDQEMCLWRTMAGGKPYLLLMNTDYDMFTSEMVERYFQRSLFYGMFPGMFSHNAADNPYWQNPKWYNRDRPLFKQYIPLIKRVAEAGWQPVTMATSDNKNIVVERFGPAANRSTYFTCFNGTQTHQRGYLHLDLATVGENSKVRALISAHNSASPSTAELDLEPQHVEVIELTPGERH